MPCRKTFVLGSLSLAGAGSALLLGLLSGFVPLNERFEIRRKASLQMVSLEPGDFPAPIAEEGDGKRVWAVRRSASKDLAAGDIAVKDANARQGGHARSKNHKGEVVSVGPEGISLATADTSQIISFEGTADGKNSFANVQDHAVLAPLVALDGVTAPTLLGVDPFRASDALDMEGRPLRWQEAKSLLSAYKPLPARDSHPEPRALPQALPAPEAPLVRAFAAGDSMSKANRYQTLVENFARRYELSTALVYAIIHSESDFSPTLVSNKSAMGLMQLLPSTASGEVHRFLYGRGGNIGFDDLRVPEINIRYGTAYLHILLTRYFQDVTDPLAREYCAVAAYNMGPNRFLRLYGANAEEAVERINAMNADQLYEDLTRRLPVRETRAYVAKVRRMKHYYAAQLATPAAVN